MPISFERCPECGHNSVSAHELCERAIYRTAISTGMKPCGCQNQAHSWTPGLQVVRGQDRWLIKNLPRWDAVAIVTDGYGKVSIRQPHQLYFRDFAVGMSVTIVPATGWRQLGGLA